MPLNPPKGADGQVIPHDDFAIDPASWLIRHIPEYHIVPDENLGGRRISSGAFSHTSDDPDFGMSVDIGQLLDELGLSQDAMVPLGMGAVRLQVGAVRALALRVGSDPMPDNVAHGQVWGVKDSKRSKLHKIVDDWVTTLENVSIW